MKSRLGVLIGLVLGGVAAISRGDDVTGKDRILCGAVHAAQCTPDGDCHTAPAWELNIPQFIEIDLKNKTVATTKASGENRASSISNVSREGGQVVFQGVQNGRAFSFVITESTGLASVTVAREDMTVSIFGACTPLPDAK